MGMSFVISTSRGLCWRQFKSVYYKLCRKPHEWVVCHCSSPAASCLVFIVNGHWSPIANEWPRPVASTECLLGLYKNSSAAADGHGSRDMTLIASCKEDYRHISVLKLIRNCIDIAVAQYFGKMRENRQWLSDSAAETEPSIIVV